MLVVYVLLIIFCKAAGNNVWKRNGQKGKCHVKKKVKRKNEREEKKKELEKGLRENDKNNNHHENACTHTV